MNVLKTVALSLSLVLTGASLAGAGWMDKVNDVLNKGGVAPPSTSSSLTSSEVAAGLRDALRVGTRTVTGQLGATDGFNADPAVHIPLPPELKTVQGLLAKIGMSGMADDLELKLNRAAEAATPKAKAIFWKAIESMTLDDAMGIYNGPENAATEYFKRQTAGDISTAMRPVIDGALNEVGAVRSYDTMMGQYRTLPFVPDVKSNLTEHALKLSLEGIFHYLAQEEAAIRRDPVKRTTDILKKVFRG